MDSEFECELTVTSKAAALSSVFLQQAHQKLFRRWPVDDLAGRRMGDSPGAARTSKPESYLRSPPPALSLPFLLARADRTYVDLRRVDAVRNTFTSAQFQLQALQPFEVGNRPALGLQTLCALQRISRGLWSMNRAFCQQHRPLSRAASYGQRRQKFVSGGTGGGATSSCAVEQEVDFIPKLLHPSRLRERLHSYVLAEIATSTRVPTLRPPSLPSKLWRPWGQSLARSYSSDQTGRGSLHPQRLLEDGLLEATVDGRSVRLGFRAPACSVLLPGLLSEHACEMFRP
jgi:hypothetical protein